MSVFLSELKTGESANIVGFVENISNKIKRRLLELGFFENVLIKLAHKSFFNEVLLLELNGYTISLRSDIAKNILVKRTSKQW